MELNKIYNIDLMEKLPVLFGMIFFIFTIYQFLIKNIEIALLSNINAILWVIVVVKVKQVKQLNQLNQLNHLEKKFNVFYYSLFGIIFGVGMYYDWMSLKLIGGVVLVTSFVGWIYANIKSYFNS